MRIARHPALLVVLVASCALAGCGGAGTHKSRARSLPCRLQVSGKRGGRAVVTYDDATGDPKMAAAISEAVSAWNASTAPVMLVPATTNAALTFRAVSGKATLPPCSGSAPRVVTVGLSTQKWNPPAGAKSTINDPPGAIAHEIGHALGLATTGSCPSLTSAAGCPHRDQAPGRSQLRILQRLYGGATPSASP